jgi:hypothetical protein
MAGAARRVAAALRIARPGAAVCRVSCVQQHPSVALPRRGVATVNSIAPLVRLPVLLRASHAASPLGTTALCRVIWQPLCLRRTLAGVGMRGSGGPSTRETNASDFTHGNGGSGGGGGGGGSEGPAGRTSLFGWAWRILKVALFTSGVILWLEFAAEWIYLRANPEFLEIEQSIMVSLCSDQRRWPGPQRAGIPAATAVCCCCSRCSTGFRTGLCVFRSLVPLICLRWPLHVVTHTPTHTPTHTLSCLDARTRTSTQIHSALTPLTTSRSRFSPHAF